MYCANCGDNNPQDARFCVSCGQPIEQAAKEMPAYATQQSYEPPHQSVRTQQSPSILEGLPDINYSDVADRLPFYQYFLVFLFFPLGISPPATTQCCQEYATDLNCQFCPHLSHSAWYPLARYQGDIAVLMPQVISSNSLLVGILQNMGFGKIRQELDM